mmetsp:Transcript_31534/g.35842  ORF Transcript_31534/g.35842 Transcript_31534/m.35842 type:complete len:354 (+) Transcript_31534:3-1064(+)
MVFINPDTSVAEMELLMYERFRHNAPNFDATRNVPLMEAFEAHQKGDLTRSQSQYEVRVINRTRFKQTKMEKQPCPFCHDLLCEGCLLSSLRQRANMREIADVWKEAFKTEDLWIKLDFNPTHEYELTKISSYRIESRVNDDPISKKNAETRDPSIYDCFDVFTDTEILGKENMWYCGVCKQDQQASKQMQIFRAPDVLTLCFKRFIGHRNSIAKNQSFVDFPLENLDLTKYIIHEGDEEYRYQLHGVINHYGTREQGHYTAFCKNAVDNEWYEFDDTRVRPTSSDQIVSRDGYVLFYQRVDADGNNIVGRSGSQNHSIDENNGTEPNATNSSNDEKNNGATNVSSSELTNSV